MNYWQIVLPKIKLKPLTYNSTIEVNIGDIVRVPFRNQQLIGIVWQKITNLDCDNSKIKDIYQKLPVPPISSNMLSFIAAAANYNFVDIASIVKMVLPIDLDKIAPEEYYQLKLSENIKFSKARLKVFEYMQDNIATAKQIIKNAPATAAIVKALIAEKILITSDPPKDIHHKNSIDLATLSDDQQEAADFLVEKLESFNVSLLEGVTGSGKTEIYFFIIAHILKQNLGQILILLPEILLTSQLIQRFKQRFGFAPCVWHSALTDKQRKNNWQAINTGEAKLIIAARSALFLPFKQLKAIIIDEEHETSFKQEDNVNYQARDMAIFRALKENISVILCSATPSLETINNCLIGKYHHLKLASRYGKASMPKIEIADMRHKNTDALYISSELQAAIAENLANNQQILLYLNRRGYAPLTLCKACGYRFTCPDCSTWLVDHRSKNCLECHHCGFRRNSVNICPECMEADCFIACGPGVERIAEEISNLFSRARILIITKDNVDNNNKAEQVINQILDRQIDIIIGTQVVAKGHHFPALSLVGIIDADLGLMGGDLRATERSYQLMHQVGGRAGREKIKGKVIIQTYNPNNPIIRAIAEDNQQEFVKLELRNRKMMNMPPFSRLAALIISGFEEDEVRQYAKYLVKCAPFVDNINIMGPVAAIISRIKRKYRYRILVRAPRNFNIQHYLQHWLEQTKTSSKIQLKVDIDPYNFF